MNASELTTISAEELKPVHLPGAIIPVPPEDSDTSIMRIEIGPAHPAMHGIVRLTTYLDGEQIVGMVPEIGY
ncbi:MAG: NADH-quinone oxidoreductase subunit D, partial [SAR324 cluster bacterium]|nr:NADH-quinone oxidoreductase subunit D [SAR324 cluster bacterium]